MKTHTSYVSLETGSGRFGTRPSEIPAGGWWNITWRLIKRLGNHNVSLVAGGVAMHVLLSVLPGLAALTSIYGLLASPVALEDFARLLPPATREIFNTQLQEMMHHSSGTLTATAVFGILAALWSARSAMAALMTATNIAYGERQKRSFIVQVLLSLAFTVAAMVAFMLMLLLGLAIPVALKVLGTSALVRTGAAVTGCALLWCVAVLGLALVYRYAPAREQPQWRWVTWGSAIAATLWLAASVLFAFYLQTYSNYTKTYGALGGVIALLIWFYISSLIAVLGAETNAAIERETREGTTMHRGPLQRI